MLRRDVPQSAIEVMIASLSDNSIKQYDVCLKKWYNFCSNNNLDLFDTTISHVIDFLMQVFDNGAKYSTLNTYRSALSLILDKKIGDDDTIKRFFKGIFRLRPSLPKYNITWDTNIVLNFLSTWYPNEDLSLEKISKKLLTLLALVTAHRIQTFSKILISNIEIFNDKVIIKSQILLKLRGLVPSNLC